MVNSLIKALKATNNITLPDFGGIMKMGSSYVFNEFLKFNDGKLSKFLQEEKGISSADADSKVVELVKEIKAALDKNGSFSLNEIGTFTLKGGKIKLEKTNSSTAATPKSKKEEKPKVAEKKEVKKSVDKKAPIEKKNISTKATTNKPIEEKPKVEAKKEIKKSVAKETPAEKKKEVKKTATKTSGPKLCKDLPEEEAKKVIITYTVVEDLVKFSNGEKRKKVVRVLRTRLNELYDIDKKELAILEATKVKEAKTTKEPKIKEGSKKEVEKQVAKESKILKTVIEKENKESAPVEQKDSTPSKKEKKAEKKKNTEVEDLAALTNGAVKLEKEAKSRKRNKIILWVAIGSILSGSGIVGYLKQDLIIGWFENSSQIVQNETDLEENQPENEETEETHISNEDSVDVIITEEVEIIEISEEVEEIIEEVEPIKETSVTTSGNGHYHAIVGSFSKEKNAINLVKKLKEEGYPDAGIIGHGKLQSVKLGSYSTSKEAKKALKESNKNGWVKKS